MDQVSDPVVHVRAIAAKLLQDGKISPAYSRFIRLTAPTLALKEKTA